MTSSESCFSELDVSATWTKKYAPSNKSVYCAIVVIPGEPDAEILVVLPSSWACRISRVPIPVTVSVAKPTCTVLIAPVVPIPVAVGIKSTLRFAPSTYAW